MKHILLRISSMITWLLAIQTFAATPIIRKFNTYSDFVQAEVTGLVIRENGALELAPELKTLVNSGEPFTWSIAMDARGSVFVGSGNDGRIYKVAADNDSLVYFDSEELEVYCMAIGPDKALYAGTSPDGKVYRITGPNQATVYADPEDTYIWDLQFDARGNLYIATGNPGTIYKVSGAGQINKFFEPAQSHIRSLLIDDKGFIYAGTANDGYIYRISPTGTGYVLYDSPVREVHDLAAGSDGAIYAAAMGEEQVTVISDEPGAKTTKEGDQDVDQGTGSGAEVPLVSQELIPAAGKAFGRGEKSSLFYITPEGGVRELWLYSDDRVQSIAVDRKGIIWVGTGDAGRLYHVTHDAKRTLVLQLDEAQITNVYSHNSGLIYLATANMGRLQSLGPRLWQSGTLVSETMDTRALAKWGSFSFEAEVPPGTNVKFWLRSGNTESPGSTWCEWIGPYDRSNESYQINCPNSRFLQWKCELSAPDGKTTPVVTSVSIAYLQQNLPPAITDIIIHPANERYLASDSRSSNSDAPLRQGGIVYPQQLTKAKNIQGYQCIDWLFDDPNADRLMFDLHYRKVEDKFWKLLAKDLESSVYNWDTHQMPDGRYVVQVTATDAPSNPPELVRTQVKVSAPFWVDNSGPVIGNFNKSNREPTTLTFTVADAINPVRMTEYSLDAGAWQLIYPVDGVCDSQVEQFQLKIDTKPGIIRTIVVRSVDDFDNIGYGNFYLNPE